MYLALTAVCLSIVCLLIVILIKRTRDRLEMEQHSITPEALYALLASNQGVLLFDVRQPLDVLVSYEIIPTAKRIPPREVLENPSLIPKEKDSIVYSSTIGETPRKDCPSATRDPAGIAVCKKWRLHEQIYARPEILSYDQSESVISKLM